MRTLVAALTFFVLTVFCGTVVLVAQLLGIPDGPDTIYEKAPRWWARGMLFVSGTRVVVHGDERMHTGEPRIFVSNHVSWYDVLVLVAYLPRYSFVAKAELFKVPLFGGAARAVGTIPIERENRKAAFQSYEEAAERMKSGRNVVVFPEGTRGTSYALRPFKKGPFVLAVAAAAPIVPTLIHGTIEVLPRHSLWLRRGEVHVHLLEPVPTAGRTYADRDALAREVYDRLAAAQQALYGIASPPLPSGGGSTAPAAGPITPSAAPAV
jgi:1-acyl-sn-glycerol-3-phosphate acyltransferase